MAPTEVPWAWAIDQKVSPGLMVYDIFLCWGLAFGAGFLGAGLCFGSGCLMSSLVFMIFCNEKDQRKLQILILSTTNPRQAEIET